MGKWGKGMGAANGGAGGYLRPSLVRKAHKGWAPPHPTAHCPQHGAGTSLRSSAQASRGLIGCGGAQGGWWWMGTWGKGRGAATGGAGGSVGTRPGALKAMAASQVDRPWKSSRALARAPSCSNSRALDLGGGGGVAEGPAAAIEQAEADRYPLSLATFWAPQPDTPERCGCGARPRGGCSERRGRYRVSSPSRCTRWSSSAPGRHSGTQHQPGKTRDLHESKITWAGIPSMTILEPVFGQTRVPVA